MTGRRAIAGLCMLCALVLSAFAAQSALAATKGTTAFTCKETGAGGTFTKAHCKPSDAGSGNFSHVAITESAKTQITSTSDGTDATTTGPTLAKLKATIAGIETELQSVSVNGKGWLENQIDPSGEHYAAGEGTIVFNGVTIAKPAGKGCKVFKDEGGKAGVEGIVETRLLKGTTTGQGDNLTIKPAAEEGSLLASFFVTCTTKVEALEGEWNIYGSVKCPTEGATIRCTHTETTAAGTLKKGAVKAGLDLVTTVGVFTPLSVTTVETP